MPDGPPDIAVVAGDEQADEDGDLVGGRAVARLDEQPAPRMLASEGVVHGSELLEDGPRDVLVAQRPEFAVLGVLLAGYPHQVGRHRLEVAGVGRGDAVVLRLEADDLVDEGALADIEDSPQAVEGNDGGQNPVNFETVQRREKRPEH